MREWRHTLQKWITQKDVVASLARKRVEYRVWEIRVPSTDPWPASLPGCQALTDLYQICDGGYFHWFHWISLSQLVERNQEWFHLLSDWDSRGDVLLAGRHVVLAEDAGGCPVVWDTTTDQVRAFQFDGGDWEPPLASSVEAFLTTLFNPKGEEDWWSFFLQQLDTI